MGGTRVTDVGAQQIARMVSLNLQRNKISDASMPLLLEMPSQKFLDLTGTGVTNQHLAMVAQAPRLVVLQLSNTGVDDQGVYIVRLAKADCECYIRGEKIGFTVNYRSGTKLPLHSLAVSAG